MVTKLRDIRALCIRAESTIKQAIECIDRTQRGIVLVTSPDLKLVATITDGDIRRALLAGQSLESSIEGVLTLRSKKGRRTPVTAAPSTPGLKLMQMMLERDVCQIPLLDADGAVVDLVTIDDLASEPVKPLEAVIMAGGFGTRMRPLTEQTPKPMLPVGDKPLLERTIEQLQQAGIEQINVTLHHLSERIVEHFGDGRAFGIRLNYIREDQPMGTGGALALLEAPRGTQLVINGDILTQVNFRSMLAYHRECQADMTVGVRHYSFKVPYGVVDCEDCLVRGLREKPEFSFFVSAGIYLLEPLVYDFIPRNGRRFDMTDLVQRLLAARRVVASFPITEYWLDIGRPDDYLQAQADVRNGRLDS